MIVNLTPHTVRLNDGRWYPPSGQVARVAASHVDAGYVYGNAIYQVVFGDVLGLPEPKDGVLYIVSGMVAAAAQRADVVSPATGHPAARRENGQIVSVPGFSRG